MSKRNTPVRKPETPEPMPALRTLRSMLGHPNRGVRLRAAGAVMTGLEMTEAEIDESIKRLEKKRTTFLLPASSAERKNTPVYSGVMAYFPRALAYVAQVSKAGNDKHNPGEPLHWSKDKSNDHADCVARHLIEHGTVDAEDKLRHSGKLAWRALALLEIELENEVNKTTA